MPMVVGLALMAVAGGVSAYGQMKQGAAENKYYQALADQNVKQGELALKTGEQKTTLAQNEAAQKAKELGMKVRETQGTQRAAMAASGTAGSLTAADVMGNTIDKAAMDEFNIQYNADVVSWGAKKEAEETNWALNNQANLYRFAGKNAKRAANIAATQTLLGTASSMFMAGAKKGN